MNNETKPYRTVFVGELEQLTGLSTGGRDGELHADSVVARDGLERPILRGTGLAGALLATLDEFDLRIPTEISARLPETAAAVQKCESLWLMHHAHLVDETVQALVRPNVAIHPWTGAAVDGLYFSTEVLPRGTRWKVIIETEDWRDRNFGTEDEAARLLALALEQWRQGLCWLGRSPARGLGWAQLVSLDVYRLDSAAASHWPNAGLDEQTSLEWLGSADVEQGVKTTDLRELTTGLEHERRTRWKLYKGTLTLGEAGEDDGQDEYGLDSLSTLARDFPADPGQWADWRTDSTQIDGTEVTAEDIDLDAAPAWTRKPDGGVEFMIPGSAIRGTFRSVLSAHWRRAGKNVWAPNGLAEEPKNAKDDPLLPVFGSIGHDSNLLVSDAYPVAGKEARMYVQELHAENEFTQGPYGSSKFNRPCLVSGTFEFQIAIRESVSGQEGPGLHGKALQEAEQLIEAAKILGQARMLPFGGGIWRGHGWVQFSLAEQGSPDVRQPELEAHDNSSAEAV